MSTMTTDPLLRPLGAFERTIDLYMHRNPVQFSLTAQLDHEVSEESLRAALCHLQQVHPLLAAEVQRPGRDDPHAAGPVFRRTTAAIPVRVARDTTWQHETALEQTEPIEPTPGPLARAILIPADHRHAGGTVVLTFAHQIADGRGALRALQDLVAILARSPLDPSALPEAQEDLLASLPSTVASDASSGSSASRGDSAAETGDEQVADASVLPRGRLRPFDKALPVVQVGDLGVDGTRALVERSRAESCTVQAALCAAAASALFATTGRERVRVNVPIDLRRAVGLDDGVVIRFSATTVTLEDLAATTFWDLARAAQAQLRAARDPETVRASASMLAQLAPSTPDEAETAMLAATAADIEITNLGLSDVDTAGGKVRAVWGPTMTTQVADEQILGVVTHGGVLRMVNVTHAPIIDLVERIGRDLDLACG